MKKLSLVILLIMPILVFGQGCQYGSSSDASELCDFYRGNNFATDQNADLALDKVLSVTGMSKRFVLKQCNDISNCVATSYKGIRYILYDKDFMAAIDKSTKSWPNLSILAHEIGHHINGHSLDLVIYAAMDKDAPSLIESRQMELEADEFSGFVMYKLGASLSEAQEAVQLVSTNDDDSYSTHPKKDKRLQAIERGYNKSKVQGSNNNDYSTSILTAEDYFYKSYNDEFDYQYQIDNYTKCLKIDPDYKYAYYNRANIYNILGKYEDAIIDYNSSIALNPKEVDAYRNRGISKSSLGDNRGAIQDFNKAIELDPNNYAAYNNRGASKNRLEDYRGAIQDYNKAIEINSKYMIAYYNRGVTKSSLGDRRGAIQDFNKALLLDPKCTEAYSHRAFLKVKLGDKPGAIQDYNKAIGINSNDAEAYYYRGLCKGSLGDMNGACLDWSKAGELGKFEAYDLIKKDCN
jgi:tetratricopeptide (TPR) repeat protein